MVSQKNVMVRRADFGRFILQQIFGCASSLSAKTSR